MKVWRPSASALQRSLNCESSAVLERPPESPRVHNAPSERGNRIHAAIERHQLGGRVEDVRHQLAEGDCPGLEHVLANLPKLTPIEGLPYVEAECWYAPLTQEAHCGTAGIPLPEGFWRGRADCIGTYQTASGAIPAVADWKTGNPRFQVKATAAQLGYFAVWLSVKLNAPEVAAIVYTTQNGEADVFVWNKQNLDSFALQLAAHEARLSLLEADQAVPTLIKSKECHFCPSKPVCPLWAKLSTTSNVDLMESARDVDRAIAEIIAAAPAAGAGLTNS